LSFKTFALSEFFRLLYKLKAYCFIRKDNFRTFAFLLENPKNWFTWCSNYLTVAFAIQCYWYKKLTGDKQFEELEQANFDWLFGLNP
jgi:hypothetical protein